MFSEGEGTVEKKQPKVNWNQVLEEYFLEREDKQFLSKRDGDVLVRVDLSPCMDNSHSPQ